MFVSLNMILLSMRLNYLSRIRTMLILVILRSETTVSLRDHAPCGEVVNESVHSVLDQSDYHETLSHHNDNNDTVLADPVNDIIVEPDVVSVPNDPVEVRRSQRARRAPELLDL